MTAYDADRLLWSEEQARALRRRARSIDTANIANAIERLGQDDVDQLHERIPLLLAALLRWAYEVDHRSIALHSTIDVQRNAIAALIDESPSLQARALDMIVDLYPLARRTASIESGPFDDNFPAGLPFLPREVLDEKYLPDPHGDDAIRGRNWWRQR